MGNEIIYPIDTANFRNLRENSFVYVDKTGYIHSLINTKVKYYFLARPRRFGKSLFLDTMAEYFSGNRELFKGLAIDRLHPEEWESYPVFRLNMSGKAYATPADLTIKIETQLEDCETLYGLPIIGGDSAPESEYRFEYRFESIIRNVAEKYGRKVVILIDEYDAPLSSAIGQPELQENYREQLHGLYSVLKNAEPYIHFCFLTGVTRYGKVSVFSGLNNLNDITFSDEYAGICGITNEELREYYSDGVVKLAEKQGVSVEDAYGLLKFNYDGYHFSESMTDIYNPYSINYAMHNCKIEDYWCQSGVPTILSKAILHNDFDISTLSGKKVSKSTLTDLSIYALNPIPLFYQTGYLTLKAYDNRRQRYTLGYPNREVESSILNNVLELYLPSPQEKRGAIYDMEDALEEGDAEGFVKLMKAFLADIPNQLHKYVSRYENYYHTIFYCLTTLMGLDVEAEYSTSEGFIDMLVKTSGYIYIIELKINGTADDAMRQIEEKHYAAPFAADSRKLVKIGLGFSTDTHNITSSLIGGGKNY
ncbi:MAG: ATP-binding protein [Muribaculaceae bacterium]|nr:ATP-binding protein [Muribaculaceae bacterium]